MLSTFLHYALNRPVLVRVAAGLLWRVGCAGLLAGAVANAVTAILNVVVSMAGSATASYHQLFPGLPTWWIPESPLGFGFYLTLLMVAYIGNDLANELQRALKY